MVNNDGKDFKVWLEDTTFTKKGNVNRTTGAFLHREGWVVTVDDVHRYNFYNKLSTRALSHIHALISAGRLKSPV